MKNIILSILLYVVIFFAAAVPGGFEIGITAAGCFIALDLIGLRWGR